MWREKVLRRIKPNKNEEEGMRAFANEVIERLNNAGFKAIVAGSIAKGTVLKENSDLDVFILLPLNQPYETFEMLVKKAKERAFPNVPYVKKYAHHPYLRLFIKGKGVDLVPAYDVKNTKDVKTPVDRTIFHTSFVRQCLKEELRDEVRLLKAFMKANGMYGAEIRTRGFSGYLCELLIIKCGGFEKALRFLSTYKPFSKVWIDGFASKHDFRDPFIFVDPVDPKRNVGSAIAMEVLSKAKILSMLWFDAKDKEQFFMPFVKREYRKELFSSLPTAFAIRFEYGDEAEDNVWGKVRKRFSQFINICEKNGIEIGGQCYEKISEKEGAVFFLSTEPSNPYFIHQGPKVEMQEHVRKFLTVHDMILFKGGKIASVKERIIKKIEDVLEQDNLFSFLPKYKLLKKEELLNLDALDKFLISLFPKLALEQKRTWEHNF